MIKNLSSRNTPPVRTLVYTRRSKAGAALPIDGADDSGWVLDENLRCDGWSWVMGAKPGVAKFTYVTLTGEDASFEVGLNKYTLDDQIKVTLLPIEDELAEADPQDPANARTVFIGVLARPTIDVQADGQREAERTPPTAFAMPQLEDTLSCHLIKGRWVYTGDDTDPLRVIETPSFPAVFNPGVPNMHAQPKLKSANNELLSAHAFTYDTDPAGEWWTYRTAIAALLTVFYFGVANDARGELPYWCDILNALVDELNKGITGETIARPDEYVGLDARLPEIDVTGMGALSALERVCMVGGFGLYIEPLTKAEADADFLQRPYVIRINRRGAGDVKYFDLDKRGTTYATAEQTTRRNRINKIVGQRDGTSIVNEVYGRGRLFLEDVFDLKPLWKPTDIAATPIDDLAKEMPLEPAADSYWSRHVKGGAQFDTYQHVGRRWGLVGEGDFDGGYTTPDDYVHDTDGFNWRAHLGLAFENNPINAARRAAGVTDEVYFMKRPRKALPLRAPLWRRQNTRFMLFISEDGGDNYTYLPIKFAVLEEYFGLMLAIKDLSEVNIDTFSRDVAAKDVARSWWGLIDSGDLRVRLGCAVEPDVAARYDAKRQASSGSTYARGQLMVLPKHEEVWTRPNHNLPAYMNWVRDFGYGTVDASGEQANVTTGVQEAAERRRDKLEDAAFPVTATTFIMDMDQWRLGDRIASIRGRDVSLAVNAGRASVYPNVVGLHVSLGSGSATSNQSIRIDLDVPSFVGGGN